MNISPFFFLERKRFGIFFVVSSLVYEPLCLAWFKSKAVGEKQK